MATVVIVVFCLYAVAALVAGKSYLKLSPLWQAASLIPLVAMVAGWIVLLNLQAEKAEPVWATITWTHAPITLYADPDVEGKSLDQAVTMWNDAAGCPLLIRSTSPSADVVVSRGAVDPVLAGRTDRNPATGQVFCQLLQPGNLTSEYLILAHELGRALGLATDPSKRSIMASGVQTQDIGSLPQVSRKDAAALKERYYR